MELNKLIDKKLTKKQKEKYKKEDSKFKLFDAIIILPIVATIIGIFMESMTVVTVSIVSLIIFLIILALSSQKKNVVFDEVIVPLVFQERFKNIEYVKNDEDIEDEYVKSGLGESYEKFDAKGNLRIHEDRYSIELYKITTSSKKETDDEDEEKVFSGMFAYVKLPENIDIDIEVKQNEKTIEEVNNMDKANPKLVIMNNLDFDLQYDVYATDPAVARKILSIGVMARILETNKKVGKVISFAIKNGVLYVLIEYNEFLEFNSENKDEYVDENIATQNMDNVEVLDYFVRYMVNLTEIEKEH